jgi:hypothetical protein
MRVSALAIGLILIGLCSSATADPEFHPYESRQPLIKEGQGGERTTVKGIDIWAHGDPPKRYQVIGSLTDERRKDWHLFGSPLMSDLPNDLAKAVKAAGGDAAVLENEQDVVAQLVNTDDGTGGVILPIQHHKSRYLVVKYLPDSPVPPAQ